MNTSSDSLGRIHAVFQTTAGIVYNVFEPGVGEVWRDTIPGSHDTGRILVDGDRVHIVFMRTDQLPDIADNGYRKYHQKYFKCS